MRDFSDQLRQLEEMPIWRAWRGFGSHLFFEMGTPLVTVSERVRPNHVVAGRSVGGRRSASVSGSHGIHIEMATWYLSKEGRPIANSESPDQAMEELVRWLQGQHLTQVSSSSGTLTMEFDLGARFELSRNDDLEARNELVSFWSERGHLSLLANGETKWSE